MINLMDILSALEQSFRVLFPSVKRVHLERIESMEEPSISVEIISYNTPVFSENIIEKHVDIDIIYFSANNRIDEGVIFGDRLKDLLGLGLKVKDRFIRIAEPPEMKFVEQDLHFLVQFEYADKYKPITIYNGKVVEIEQGVGNISDNEKEEVVEGDLIIHRDKLEYMQNLYADFEIDYKN